MDVSFSLKALLQAFVSNGNSYIEFEMKQRLKYVYLALKYRGQEPITKYLKTIEISNLERKSWF